MWINFFILAPILSCFCRIPHGKVNENFHPLCRVQSTDNLLMDLFLMYPSFTPFAGGSLPRLWATRVHLVNRTVLPYCLQTLYSYQNTTEYPRVEGSWHVSRADASTMTMTSPSPSLDCLTLETSTAISLRFCVFTPLLSCSGVSILGDAIGWPIEAAERMLDCLAGMAGGSKAPPSRRLPSDHPWVRRGWLVMMRARYQTSLMRPAEGWMATCRRCFKRPRELAHPDAMANTTPTVYDIELQEFRAHGTNLSQIVVAAVEVEEEGLFRHIVMYL